MKPINCNTCGYLEKVDTVNGRDASAYAFCMKSYRMIDDGSKKPDDCPLDERLKDNADKKGFYLIKDEDGKCGEML